MLAYLGATYWYETLQNVSEPVRRTFFPPPGLSLPNPSESHLSSAVTLLYHILWLQPSLGLDCSSAMAFARSSARYHRFLTVTDWNTLSICAHSTTFQRLASLSTGYESRWLALCDFIKPHINTIRTIGRVRIPFYRQNFGKAIPKVITDKFPKNMLFEDEWYNEERKNPYYYAVVSEQGGVCPAKEIADYEYLLRCEPERTSENREIVNAWERKKLPLFEEKADNDEDEEPCPLCLVTGCKCSMELIAPVRVEVFETSDGRGRGLRALEVSLSPFNPMLSLRYHIACPS